MHFELCTSKKSFICIDLLMFYGFIDYWVSLRTTITAVIEIMNGFTIIFAILHQYYKKKQIHK